MISTHSDLLQVPTFHAMVKKLYGQDALATQAHRYQALASQAAARGHREVCFFSTPGRTELAGNHTDHNRGRVLAAAVHLDAIAAAAPRTDDKVVIASDGFPAFEISLGDTRKVPSESGTPTALLRGIVARLSTLGYALGGFDAFVHSDVPTGSGLSSSAVVEVLWTSIFNHFWNGGAIGATDMALVAQFAENQYFGKPCGLMDPLTCATGGVVAIDFATPENPTVRSVALDMATLDADLIIVNTGENHADLTDDYAAIPREMKAVAQAFDLPTCRGLEFHQLLSHLPTLRSRLADRAILRALHYLGENQRVEDQVAALEQGRSHDFFRLVRESGLSSFRWLQNIVSPTGGPRQSIALALALTEEFLAGSGACRVHGGGFAGTIQAWVPRDRASAYQAFMSPVFGLHAVTPLQIRDEGAIVLP
jgi:galactokinase